MALALAGADRKLRDEEAKRKEIAEGCAQTIAAVVVFGGALVVGGVALCCGLLDEMQDTDASAAEASP